MKKEAHLVETPLKHGSRGEIFRRFAEPSLVPVFIYLIILLALVVIFSVVRLRCHIENPSIVDSTFLPYKLYYRPCERTTKLR